MNQGELNDLKARIVAQMDVTQVLDILGFDLRELVDILEDFVNEQADDFEDVL